MSGAFDAVEFYTRYKDALDLTWFSAREQRGRSIAADPARWSFSDLAGFLNPVRPSDFQVLGRRELDSITALGDDVRAAIVGVLTGTPPVCLIVADGMSAPSWLLATGCPVFGSPRPGDQVVDFLRQALPERLAASTVLHGVFLEVFGLGVLITGPSGVGKSELALAALRRGHRLVCDDAPEFIRTEPGVVRGRCPQPLWGLLEVRDLGVVNVPALFGYTALARERRLDLIVRLEQAQTIASYGEHERLSGTLRPREVLGVMIPERVLHPGFQRDLTAMFETAVRVFQAERLGCSGGAELFDRGDRGGVSV